MARALSHIATEIVGSLGGLTYQRGTTHPIVMRARTSSNQMKSAAAWDNAALFEAANKVWRSFTDAQRLQVIHWMYLNDRPFFGPKPYTPDSARLGWLTVYRLARKTGLVTFSTPIAQLLPSPFNQDRQILFGQWNSTVPGRIGLVLSAVNVYSSRWYLQVSGPYNKTTMRRPHGFKSAGSQTVTINTSASFTVPFNGYKSGRIYFARVDGIATNTSGLCYLAHYETRILVL